MTQEDKQLLLKDLSGRLFCGVKYTIYDDKTGNTAETLLDIRTSIENEIEIDLHSIEDVKLYLRPMSSMTEEEREELCELCEFFEPYNDRDDFSHYGIEIIEEFCVDDEKIPLREINYKVIDWLIAHHFDYRGLIEKGLALEAPNDMYKTE